MFRFFQEPKVGSDPLSSIFVIRNSLLTTLDEANNGSDWKLLNFIPTLDKNSLSHLSSMTKQKKGLKTIFREIGIQTKFNEIILSEIRESIMNNKTSFEIMIITISYASLLWFCDDSPKFRVESEFCEIVEFLSHLVNLEPKLSCIISYSFKKLLKASLSENGIKWSNNSFRAVFSHLFLNSTLTVSVFHSIVNFFRKVIEINTSESITEMLATISMLINENRSFINWSEISLLVNIFAPFINNLEQRSLNLISLISKRSGSTAIVDVFVLLPSLLLNFFDLQQKETSLTENETNPQPIVDSNTLPYRFVRSSTFSDGFLNLNIEQFDEINVFPETLLSNEINNNINIVSECIGKADNFCRTQFYESFMNLLKPLKNTNEYKQICFMLILIMSKTIDSVSIELFTSVIHETMIFDPKYCIYSKEGLCDSINFFRSFVFKMVGKKNPSAISTFFQKANYYPLLMTENLIRVYSLPGLFSIYTFVNDEDMKYICQSGLQLFQMAANNVSHDVIHARSDFFVLMSKLCRITTIFSSKYFANSFLWFLFETDLTDYILNILRDGISSYSHNINNSNISIYQDNIEATVSFVLKVCKTINESPTEDEQQYTKLAVKLISSLSIGLSHNPSVFPQFEPILNDIFQILLIKPNSELLNSCLTIMEMYVQINKKETFKISHLHIFSKAIQMIDGNYPSYSTYRHFFNMLSLSSSMVDYEHIHIKKPSVLPLLLFCFGKSEKLNDLIRHFHRLSLYSAVNARSFADGDVDGILLDFISLRKEFAEVKYRGINISLHFDLKSIESIVLPFLCSIFSWKSNNSISSRISDMVVHNIDSTSLLMCSALANVIAFSINLPHPRFQLGSSQPMFSIDHIPSEVFKQKFRFSFECNLDYYSILESNTSLFLFSVIDPNGTILRVFVDHLSLFLYVSNGSNDDCIYQILRVLPEDWHKYEIEFSPSNNSDSLRVRLILDGNITTVSIRQMFHFTFESEFVKIEIGGFNKAALDWLNVELCQIAHFSLNNLFSTDMVTRFHKKCVFENDKGIRINIDGNLQMTHNLLFYLLKGSFANSICRFFDCEGNDNCLNDKYSLFPNEILNLLDQIFRLSKEAQIAFNSVDSIAIYFSSHPQFLNGNLFSCLVSIFHSITYRPLSLKWFERLILDLWLWKKSAPKDFRYILYYFSKQFIFQCPQYLSQNLYFATLLDQFYLMFCLKNEPNDFFEQQNYSLTDVIECRELFELFLKRIVQIGISKNDFDVLLYHLCNANSKETIKTMLNFLVHSKISDIKNDIQNEKSLIALHPFLKIDHIDIVIGTLILIHKISGPLVLCHLISASKEIFNFFENDELFDKISQIIYEYPNLYHLLCIFALELQSKKESTLNFDENSSLKIISSLLLLIAENEETSIMFEFCEFWFLYPLLLSFEASEKHKHIFCHFFGKMILKSPNQKRDLVQIYSIYELFGSEYDFSFEIFKTICENDDKSNIPSSLIKHIIIRCYYSTFYHFTKISRNKTITDLITDSEMCYRPTFSNNNIEKQNRSMKVLEYNENNEYSDKKCESKCEKLVIFTHSLKGFLEFISSNFSEYSMKYQFRLDLHYQWIDDKKAKYAQSLLKKIDISESSLFDDIEMAFTYFINKDELSDIEQRINILTKLNYSFDLIRLNYDRKFKESISVLSTNLNSFYQKISELTDAVNRFDSSEYKNASIKLLQSEIDKASQLYMPQKRHYSIYKRSLINGPLCCPYSMKRTLSQCRKKANPFLVSSTPIFCAKAIRIKLDKVNSFNFRLFKNVIHLSEKKHIKLKDIYMILTRRREERETAIEIFTTDGRTFLLDFLTIEYSIIIKSFFNLSLPSIELIQKYSSLDTINSMQITSRWVNNQVSNFKYLMTLNIISGRTFNDPVLYPIFPSFLLDFDDENETIDFSKTKIKYQNPNMSRVNINKIDDKTTLKQILMEQHIVCADFYFFSNLIFPIIGNSIVNNKDSPKIDILPKWANSSKCEFVYKLRKLLESESVSNKLNIWIDNVFGSNTRSIPHRRLFISNHPSRNIIGKDENDHKIIHLSLKNIEIKNAVTINRDFETIDVVFLLKSGSLMNVTFNSNDFTNPKIVIKAKVSVEGRFTATSSYEGQMVIAARDKQRLFVWDKKELRDFLYVSDTNFVFCSKSYVTFCPDSTSIANMAYGGDAKIIWRTDSRIIAVEASWKFKIVAVATVDGKVRVGSLRNGREVNSYTFYEDDEVQRIAITDSWGFIIINMIGKLVVLNVDGELIKEVCLKHEEIIRWFKYTDRNGFDFIVYENEKHILKCFEAFYPEKIVDVYHADSEVLNVEFDLMSESFLIIRKSGRISKVPRFYVY